ncbi:MAG TPA: GNAT family N-acetyltransferase [Acidimicrobiales bacterium]
MKTEVTDNPDEARYELTADGELAGFSQYRDMGDGGATRVFTHTEVFKEFGGKGLGTVLVEGALADVRAQGKRLVALCPFVDRYVREHDGWADLIDPELDAQLRA